MSEDITQIEPRISGGPSSRRIKLLEEAYAEQAIARLAQHDVGSRDWARGENKAFHVPVVDSTQQ